MLRTLVCLVGCLFFTGFVATQAPKTAQAPSRSTPANPAASLTKKADQLRVAHQYQQAIDTYQKAVAADSKAAAAYIGMGIAWLKLFAFDNAEAALKKGLAIAPSDITALRYLAETYLSGDRTAEATGVLKQALALAPDRYDLHYLLAWAYSSSDRADDAKLEYGKAEALAGVEVSHNRQNGDVYWVLASIQGRLGKYEEAIGWDKKWVAVDPGDAEAHIHLGDDYYQLKRYPEAIAEFQAGIKIDPTNMYSHALLGYAYNLSGRKEEAKAEWREAIRVAPAFIQRSPRVASNYSFLGGLYTSLGQPDEALTWYKKAVEVAPGDYWAHMTLAYKYDELKRCADAVPEFQAASRIRPKELSPWAGLINCYSDLHRWLDVISAGEQALKLKSNDPMMHNVVGVAYYELKRYQEAIAAFREAVRLMPNDADKANLATIHRNLGYAYLAVGNRDGAMQEYNILKGLDAAKAAALLSAVNPPQTAAAAPAEPAPRIENFRVRALRSNTETPAGHEKVGYYIYNYVTNLNSGQPCTLWCWRPLSGAHGCYSMRPGDTYNAKREFRYFTHQRRPSGYEYYGTEVEMNVNGANVWVGVNGCAKD